MPLENTLLQRLSGRRQGEKMTLHLGSTKFLKYHKTERAVLWSMSRFMKGKAEEYQENQ